MNRPSMQIGLGIALGAGLGTLGLEWLASRSPRGRLGRFGANAGLLVLGSSLVIGRSNGARVFKLIESPAIEVDNGSR